MKVIITFDTYEDEDLTPDEQERLFDVLCEYGNNITMEVQE